ncbi:MAG: hypothetical protein GY696_07270 [Gammaproteobacteria bacterium]|nr:hypothetical protein [Gammaproteobacteria bacterium]
MTNSDDKAESLVKFWDERRGIIRTRKGGWVLGKGVTSHGYSILDELLGNTSFFQVLILNVTGRLPERRLAEWLEAAFICMSWPDPRLWPNTIGALGGTMQASSIGAVCAGTLASESRIYGPGTSADAWKFTLDTFKERENGWSVQKIVEKRCSASGKLNMPGYIRPLAQGDERVAAMQGVAEGLGFEVGPHLQLAYEIEAYVYREYEEGMNLAGYIGAFMADQGFEFNEIHRMCSLLVNAGVHACYSEAADRPPESFLPLRCDDIEYKGAAERPVPTG